MPNDATIAYFSMEIALDPRMPTYSGGLGVLAGDTVRTAADLGVSDGGRLPGASAGLFPAGARCDGGQHERPEGWPVESLLESLAARVTLQVAQRPVQLRAWQYRVRGCRGHEVPVVFLDSDVEGNHPDDRRLTDHLYGGDARYRLAQEMLLGMGGVRMLRALGFLDIRRFHMNEGHSALLTLELLDEQHHGNGHNGVGEAEIERGARAVRLHHPHPGAGRARPVPPGAGWRTAWPASCAEAARSVRRGRIPPGASQRRDLRAPRDALHHGLQLNMTYLALNLSRHVNGVAHRHGEISRLMFAEYAVDAITNGVHAATWIAPPMAALLDRYVAGWQNDNYSLRYALAIPLEEIATAHAESKRALLAEVTARCGVTLDPQRFTLGFARRATAYKRPDLLFHDFGRLRDIARAHGGVQAVFAGKAHPADAGGKALIREVHAAARDLREEGVEVVWLPDYGTQLAALLVAGVDVWLNTPLPPNEASGTSGMKAAMNGVPSLSTLDGWWIEGHLEGITGWSIGNGSDGRVDEAMVRARDAESLYDKLEQTVMPCYYERPEAFRRIQRRAIALNGSFFNSQRMLHQYIIRAYE
jgi:glycogen phosphorylase